MKLFLYDREVIQLYQKRMNGAKIACASSLRTRFKKSQITMLAHRKYRSEKGTPVSRQHFEVITGGSEGEGGAES